MSSFNMTEEYIDRIGRFYNTVRRLPNQFPDYFNEINSSAKKDFGTKYHVHISATTDSDYRWGPKKRMDLWRERILKEYDSQGLEDIIKENGLKVEISNHLLQSKLSLTDGKRISLDIWSPKFSTLLSPLFGNRIKAEYKKQLR